MMYSQLPGEERTAVGLPIIYCESQVSVGITLLEQQAACLLQFFVRTPLLVS